MFNAEEGKSCVSSKRKEELSGRLFRVEELNCLQDCVGWESGGKWSF